MSTSTSTTGGLAAAAVDAASDPMNSTNSIERSYSTGHPSGGGDKMYYTYYYPGETNEYTNNGSMEQQRFVHVDGTHRHYSNQQINNNGGAVTQFLDGGAGGGNEGGGDGGGMKSSLGRRNGGGTSTLAFNHQDHPTHSTSVETARQNKLLLQSSAGRGIGGGTTTSTTTTAPQTARPTTTSGTKSSTVSSNQVSRKYYLVNPDLALDQHAPMPTSCDTCGSAHSAENTRRLERLRTAQQTIRSTRLQSSSVSDYSQARDGGNGSMGGNYGMMMTATSEEEDGGVGGGSGSHLSMLTNGRGVARRDYGKGTESVNGYETTQHNLAVSLPPVVVRGGTAGVGGGTEVAGGRSGSKKTNAANSGNTAGGTTRTSRGNGINGGSFKDSYKLQSEYGRQYTHPVDQQKRFDDLVQSQVNIQQQQTQTQRPSTTAATATTTATGAGGGFGGGQKRTVHGGGGNVFDDYGGGVNISSSNNEDLYSFAEEMTTRQRGVQQRVDEAEGQADALSRDVSHLESALHRQHSHSRYPHQQPVRNDDDGRAITVPPTQDLNYSPVFSAGNGQSVIPRPPTGVSNNNSYSHSSVSTARGSSTRGPQPRQYMRQASQGHGIGAEGYVYSIQPYPPSAVAHQSSSSDAGPHTEWEYRGAYQEPAFGEPSPTAPYDRRGGARGSSHKLKKRGGAVEIGGHRRAERGGGGGGRGGHGLSKDAMTAKGLQYTRIGIDGRLYTYTRSQGWVGGDGEGGAGPLPGAGGGNTYHVPEDIPMRSSARGIQQLMMSSS